MEKTKSNLKQNRTFDDTSATENTFYEEKGFLERLSDILQVSNLKEVLSKTKQMTKQIARFKQLENCLVDMYQELNGKKQSPDLKELWRWIRHVMHLFMETKKENQFLRNKY